MIITDDELLHYCDGNLDKKRAELIEKMAAEDNELARRIALMNASNLPYKEAFESEQLPEMPESLSLNVEKILGEDRQSNNALKEELTGASDKLNWAKEIFYHKRIIGLAASFAFCFSIGYLVANWNGQADTALIQASDDQADWVKRVADYQTLYVENTVSSLVPNDAATTALLNKMEQTSELKTGVPDLSEHGYTFVRAQELGYKAEPLVQLVYYKPGKAPLALCYMPSDGESSAELTIGEHEDLHTADWIHNGQRFVIVGSEPTHVMRRLYESALGGWI